MPEPPAPDVLTRPNGVSLAYWHDRRGRPTVVFLPGFRSDMTGEKACACAEWCAGAGVSCLRLDYAGHGASGGAFADGTIGSWAGDALAVIDTVSAGPLVLVGSSMGGWIAGLLARARPERVAGLIGIAAAPDFTEDLVWGQMSEDERAALLRDGRLQLPSAYSDEPDLYTAALIEDGRRNLVLGGTIPFRGPARLLHGEADEIVPWRTALRFADALASADVRVTLVKDGDHRLSRPQDLALLTDVLAETVATVRAEAG